MLDTHINPHIYNIYHPIITTATLFLTHLLSGSAIKAYVSFKVKNDV